MPLEWLHVLNMEGVDKVSTLQKLKYELTVSDVYDLLELCDVDEMYRVEQEKENNRK